MAGAPAAMMDCEVIFKMEGTWVIDTMGQKSDPDRFNLEGSVLPPTSYLNRQEIPSISSPVLGILEK